MTYFTSGQGTGMERTVFFVTSLYDVLNQTSCIIALCPFQPLLPDVLTNHYYLLPLSTIITWRPYQPLLPDVLIKHHCLMSLPAIITCRPYQTSLPDALTNHYYLTELSKRMNNEYLRRIYAALYKPTTNENVSGIQITCLHKGVAWPVTDHKPKVKDAVCLCN